MNTCRGATEKGPYKVPQSELNNDFDLAQRMGLQSFVAAGGGLLSLHVAPTSCPDWPEMMKITGGGWVWGRSWHPPYTRFDVKVTDKSHPAASGLSDFATDDEIYCDVEIAANVACYMSAWHAGVERPLAWSHQYGRGRVINLSLGHDRASVENDGFRKAVLGAIDWISSSS